jgi:glucokinase
VNRNAAGIDYPLSEHVPGAVTQCTARALSLANCVAAACEQTDANSVAMTHHLYFSDQAMLIASLQSEMFVCGVVFRAPAASLMVEGWIT